MFAASKSGSVSEPKDSKFNYVTMLLHGNAANGAQNNTFLDSSTNNFTITRNGNTTQGTFTPYGSNWSNYFNGSSYLTVPSSSAFKPASSDFTIEAWVFVSNTGVLQTVYGDCDSGTNNGMCELSVSSTLKVEVDYFTSSTAVVTKLTTGSIQANAWNHICVSKTGTTMYIGYNGTLETFTGVPSTMQSPATLYPALGRLGAYAGYYINGYISNFRFVVGSAVYTGSTYTVPISPLTAISGTSLLTCQSNRFIDNSSNSFAITTGGSSSVQRFSPFSPTTAYSTSVIGGSGYFDGTGDYLTTAANTAFAFGTGDFTIEFWAYKTADTPGSYDVMFGTGDAGTGVNGYFIELSATRGFVFASGNAVVLSYSMNPNTSSWSHYAVTRSGTTLRLFINGAVVASTTYSTSLTSTVLVRIGGTGNTFFGYMTDLRVLKGTAQYTTTYTPPTAPLTAITNTSLLLSYTNAGIFDNAMMNDLETVGNAQISTSVKKYGSGSMYFDGAGDYLDPAGGTVNALGSGDWTIEFWLYLNSLSGTNIIDYRSASVLSNTLCVNYSSGMQLYVNNTTTAIQGSALSTSTWYHVAVCKSGSSTKMFVNGTQAGSTYTDTNNYVAGANRPRIGSGGDAAGNYLNGYIDDLRITKGYARYTSNFTAPTAAFADKG